MKKNLYRLLAIAAAVLAVLMVLSLAACSTPATGWDLKG